MRERHKKRLLLPAALLLAVLLAGCAGEAATEPTPEPTATVEPTAEPTVEPTPTPEPEDPKLRALRERLQRAEPGDVVRLGRYEQDAVSKNGAEDIYWLVLAKEDGRLLLLSKYALDMQCFNDINDVTVAWEQSTLRAWLNEQFYESAFNEQEKELIALSVLKNGDNPHYPHEAPDTEDRVFLLSVGELETYLSAEKDRMVYATAFAKKKGVEYWDGRCWWWTRSPGTRPGNTSYVNTGGVFVHKHVSTYKYAVRPAVWCDLTGMAPASEPGGKNNAFS